MGGVVAEAGGTAVTGWCDYLCDFPDDADVTLNRVLDAMPTGSGSSLTHTTLPYYRARLSSRGAAIALAITVPGALQIDGVTDDIDVLVPLSARRFCEQQIVDLNHGHARWTQLERIEAREDVWETFERLWRRHWRQ